MAEFQTMFKDAWSQALVGLNNAEQEAEKVLAKIADAAGFSPDDVRRHAREFGDRLASQRKDLERALDEAVKRATSKFKLPSREEIEALKQRVDSISQRVDALASKEPRA